MHAQLWRGTGQHETDAYQPLKQLSIRHRACWSLDVVTASGTEVRHPPSIEILKPHINWRQEHAAFTLRSYCRGAGGMESTTHSVVDTSIHTYNSATTSHNYRTPGGDTLVAGGGHNCARKSKSRASPRPGPMTTLRTVFQRRGGSSADVTLQLRRSRESQGLVRFGPGVRRSVELKLALR